MDNSTLCMKIIKSKKEMHQGQLDYFLGKYLGLELGAKIV
jgi:hypothetical protein